MIHMIIPIKNKKTPEPLTIFIFLFIVYNFCSLFIIINPFGKR